MARVLVTGASSGIGRELARQFAADGAEVILVARRRDRLERLAAEIGGAAVECVDLTDRDERAALVARRPDVDVLVNNAGAGTFGPFAETDRERLLADLWLDVEALVDLSRAYLPGMIARGRGGVLNVASTAAFQPGPWMAAYYAAKAYVLSLSEALAVELRGTGVTVTALCPGPTATEFQQRAGLARSRLLGLAWMASPESVARAGIAGFRRRRAVVVPGLVNRAGVLAVRALPRAWVRRLVGRLQRAL